MVLSERRRRSRAYRRHYDGGCHERTCPSYLILLEDDGKRLFHLRLSVDFFFSIRFFRLFFSIRFFRRFRFYLVRVQDVILRSRRRISSIRVLVHWVLVFTVTVRVDRYLLFLRTNVDVRMTFCRLITVNCVF